MFKKKNEYHHLSDGDSTYFNSVSNFYLCGTGFLAVAVIKSSKNKKCRTKIDEEMKMTTTVSCRKYNVV